MGGTHRQLDKNYLSNRSQLLQHKKGVSETVRVISGVPDGSALAPVLFALSKNDITNNIPVNIRLFADDCIIYREIISFDDPTAMNNEFNDQ